MTLRALEGDTEDFTPADFCFWLIAGLVYWRQLAVHLRAVVAKSGTR